METISRRMVPRMYLKSNARSRMVKELKVELKELKVELKELKVELSNARSRGGNMGSS